MDSSQQALQTNEKFFLKFQISFRNFGYKQKNLTENRKILKKIERREY